MTGLPHGRQLARKANWLVIEAEPLAASPDPCRPAGINAGFLGLLEPEEQTEQPAPLADGTRTDS